MHHPTYRIAQTTMSERSYHGAHYSNDDDDVVDNDDDNNNKIIIRRNSIEVA